MSSRQEGQVDPGISPVAADKDASLEARPPSLQSQVDPDTSLVSDNAALGEERPPSKQSLEYEIMTIPVEFTPEIQTPVLRPSSRAPPVGVGVSVHGSTACQTNAQTVSLCPLLCPPNVSFVPHWIWILMGVSIQQPSSSLLMRMYGGMLLVWRRCVEIATVHDFLPTALV